MAAITLHTKYPCCGGGAHIGTDAPRESYKRTCPRCGKRWLVYRRSASDQTRASVGAAVDVLEWKPEPIAQELF